MLHPDEGTLNALLDGEVPSTEAQELEEHLARCEECRERLESAHEFRSEALALIGQLDEAVAMPALAAAAAPRATEGRPVPASPATERARRRWSPMATRLAWAASVLLAASLGYLAQGRAGQSAIEADAPTPLALGASDSSPVDKLAAADQDLATEPAPSTEAREAAGDERKPATPARQTPTAVPSAKRADTVVKDAREEEQPPPPPPTPARESVAAERAAEPSAPLRESRRADQAPALLRARDAAGRPGNALPGGKDVTALEAITWLGGSIRLVEGWTPERFELTEPKLRVHYGTAFGPVVLEQWRVGDSLKTTLLAPPSTPKDSVLAWERRVK
ncbi:MAG: zf-HC2 domain-containing protein [Gemmatimonadales bacterium]